MFQDSVPAGSYNDPFLSSVRVFSGDLFSLSLSLLQQHRSEFRLTPTPWFWFVCAICDLTGLFGDDWQGWKWGLTSDLLRIDIESGKLQQWQRRITGRRSA